MKKRKLICTIVGIILGAPLGLVIGYIVSYSRLKVWVAHFFTELIQ